MLAGVSLKVMPGESLVIIGGSGTGKSVTLKCILGILDPRRRRDPDRRPALRPHRPPRLPPPLRHAVPGRRALRQPDGLAERRLPPAPRPQARSSRRAARDLAIAKLARVGLGPETADLYPAELSGGMQKRVGLARAIATDPAVIFFDEPTAGLDPILAGVINDLIRELVTEMGATAITITHDMTTVRTVADHVAMLHDGVVRWHGPIDAMDAAADPYLDQFIHGRADGPIETRAVNVPTGFQLTWMRISRISRDAGQVRSSQGYGQHRQARRVAARSAIGSSRTTTI